MQFPVPQFTDVEDKIIGPLTLKQFGIIFGAGVVVFLGYSASGKNLTVLIVLALVFGIPALGFAFGKFNGRPVYNSLGQIARFTTSDKVLVFHKEVYSLNSQAKLKDAQIAPAEIDTQNIKNPKDQLKEVQSLLQKQAEEEKELVGKLR